MSCPCETKYRTSAGRRPRDRRLDLDRNPPPVLVQVAPHDPVGLQLAGREATHVCEIERLLLRRKDALDVHRQKLLARIAEQVAERQR